MLGFLFSKEMLKYVALPEIMPRIRALLFGGFGYVPFFIAVVYQMVGILPKNHPYIMQKNIGRFGIRHVLAEAANNISFSIKNIDQVIVFIAVMAGIVLFIIQFFAIASVFFLQPALALPTTWGEFFTISDPTWRSQDIAYMMLDMVFGVPHPSVAVSGFFESCIGTAADCYDVSTVVVTDPDTGATAATSVGNTIKAFDDSMFAGIDSTIAEQLSPLAPGAYNHFPFPFHDGLHKIFGVYSTGLLIIAVMMTSYFVATILGETAQTGTPFGKRFNKTWAPLRIVIAFGLLVPLTVGLNSAQYLVLYSAKYGSAFASNGWRYFNNTLTTSYLGAEQSMISAPNIPELKEITKFLFVAKTCKYAYDYYRLTHLNAEDKNTGGTGKNALATEEAVHAYLLLEDSEATNYLRIDSSTTYFDIVSALPNNTIKPKIRFGILDPEANENSHSGIVPVCGDIMLPWTDGRAYSEQEPYVRDVQEAYFNELISDGWFDDLWDGLGTPAYTPGTNHRYKYIVDEHINGILAHNSASTVVDKGTDVNHDTALDSEYVQAVNDRAKENINVVMTAAIGTAVASGFWGAPSASAPANSDVLYSRGWAAAGIWYNRIAQVNGQLTGAAFSVPMVLRYPAVMELVSDKRAMYGNMLFALEKYKPDAPAIGDIGLLLDQRMGKEFADALNEAYTQWMTAEGDQASQPTGNPILSYISYLFGLTGLYNMRENAANNTHPLAQLSGVGKSLVESSIRSLGIAAGTSIFGSALGGAPRQMAYVVASFFVTMAMLGLTVGFVLFYVLPFLPFIYFFFAVGGWIKGIFEALVGAPLWALAHIRIDGHGMPGNAAMNGYFLIFEVFLRPILIVFGMLASITIYAALVNVLNSIFSLVTENTAGYDIDSEAANPRFTLNFMRSLIDEFFFTVIYTIIVYMLGMSSFKLVDTMPNNILRWMGQSVATFGDQREDPAQGLVSRASIGSQQVLGKVGGGLGGMVNAATGPKRG